MWESLSAEERTKQGRELRGKRGLRAMNSNYSYILWRFIPLTATITYRRRYYNASVLQAERLIQAGEVGEASTFQTGENRINYSSSFQRPSHGHQHPRLRSDWTHPRWQEVRRGVGRRRNTHNAAHARTQGDDDAQCTAWSVRISTNSPRASVNVCHKPLCCEGRGSSFCIIYHLTHPKNK